MDGVFEPARNLGSLGVRNIHNETLNDGSLHSCDSELRIPPPPINPVHPLEILSIFHGVPDPFSKARWGSACALHHAGHQAHCLLIAET